MCLLAFASAKAVKAEPSAASDGPRATATASGQTHACVTAALNGVQILKGVHYGPQMGYPGDRKRQIISAEAKLVPVSADCLPLISRNIPRAFFKIQRPNDHKKWSSTKPAVAYIWRENGPEQVDGNSNGIAEASFAAVGGKPIKKSLLYRCSPGRGITRVQAVFKVSVVSAADGRTLGRKIYSAPVDILALFPDLVRNGGVPHEC
jgi:hypothetical protein